MLRRGYTKNKCNFTPCATTFAHDAVLRDVLHVREAQRARKRNDVERGCKLAYARYIRQQRNMGSHIYFVPAPRPVEVERHALWILLTKGKRTPRGLDLLQLRTIDGKTYATFDATARALGLINDEDNHGFLAVEVRLN